MAEREASEGIPFDAVKDDARELVELIIQWHHEKDTVAKLAAKDVEPFVAARVRAAVERACGIGRQLREEHERCHNASDVTIPAIEEYEAAIRAAFTEEETC